MSLGLSRNADLQGWAKAGRTECLPTISGSGSIPSNIVEGPFREVHTGLPLPHPRAARPTWTGGLRTPGHTLPFEPQQGKCEGCELSPRNSCHPLQGPAPPPAVTHPRALFGGPLAHLHAGHIDAGPHLELGTHLEDTGYTVQEHVVELGGHGGGMGSSSGPFV